MIVLFVFMPEGRIYQPPALCPRQTVQLHCNTDYCLWGKYIWKMMKMWCCLSDESIYHTGLCCHRWDVTTGISQKALNTEDVTGSVCDELFCAFKWNWTLFIWKKVKINVFQILKFLSNRYQKYIFILYYCAPNLNIEKKQNKKKTIENILFPFHTKLLAPRILVSSRLAWALNSGSSKCSHWF